MATKKNVDVYSHEYSLVSLQKVGLGQGINGCNFSSQPVLILNTGMILLKNITASFHHLSLLDR